jgi:hypothetical protein
MKKAIALVSVLSTLAFGMVPAFAEGNGNITINGGTGNTYNVNNTTNVNNSTNVYLTDIGGHWAESYIKDLVKKGVLAGDDQHKFHPANDVTRAQWAKMVARYFNLKNTSTTQDFVDVPTDSWEYSFVEATKDYFDSFMDLNGGYDFKPDQGVKREDATYTLVKVLAKVDPNVQVMDAAEAEEMLKERFSDAKEIAPALKPYAATAVKYHLINGDGHGHFMPKKVLSRAESAKLLDLLQGNLVSVGDGSTTTDGTTTDGTTTTGTSN